MNIFYLNAVITIISLIIILGVLHFIIFPTLKNANQFKLYALRDKLALLVMQGKIQENKKEYQLLMNLIITTINFYEKDFSITNFFSEIIYPQLKEQAHFSKEIRKIKKNKELNIIYSDFFKLFEKKILSDTFFLRKLAIFLYFIFSFFDICIDNYNLISATIQKNEDLKKYKTTILDPALAT